MTEILRNILVVGIGSFIGGTGRYLVSLVMKGIGKGFPWGTVIVNLLGCLLIGLFWGFFSRSSSQENSCFLFLTVGVCGGFTTFSTFSKEALAMLQCGNYLNFIAYICISIIAGLALTTVGYTLVK